MKVSAGVILPLVVNDVCNRRNRCCSLCFLLNFLCIFFVTAAIADYMGKGIIILVWQYGFVVCLFVCM